MDLQRAKADNGPAWAWARTGAVILFVVTGILLIASLSQARSLNGVAGGYQTVSAASSKLPLQSARH